MSDKEKDVPTSKETTKKMTEEAGQPAADAAAGDGVADASRFDAMVDEAREAYERARDELSETAERLREEISSIDAQQVADNAKTWVKENPGLSVLLAVGAGILLGKAVSDVMRKDPPTLSERLRSESGRLLHDARRYAGRTGASVSRRVEETGEHLAEHARALGDQVQRQASLLSDQIAEQRGELTSEGMRRTQDWIASVSGSAERAARSLQDAARDLSSSASQRIPDRLPAWDGLSNIVKSIFGAVAFKKISDWIKERY